MVHGIHVVRNDDVIIDCDLPTLTCDCCCMQLVEKAAANTYIAIPKQNKDCKGIIIMIIIILVGCAPDMS